jgi:malonate transporter and related proteins
MDVLARVIPFFLLIGLGAVIARLKLMDVAGARALAAYVFWVAFPALLIHSLAAMPPPDAALGAGLAAYAVGATAPLFVALLVGRLAKWDRPTRGGTAMASATTNTAFLGAPLAAALFGQAASAPASAVVAIDCTVIMALATAALRSAAEGTSAWRAAAKTLRNPLVAAALIGGALWLSGFALPAPLDLTLGMLRATASPVGLVALGIVIGLEAGRPSRRDSAALGLVLMLKLALAPALVWILIGMTDATPLFRATATLLAACPTAVSVFIQTRAYGAFERGGALAVVLTTVGAAITLPILGAMLQP